MLNYKELENIARLKQLSLMNAEKDYLQDLILFSVFSNVGSELLFKGGTCLYKFYRLNRFSEDLDFTLSEKLNFEKLANKISSDLMLLNIKSRIKEIKEYKNEANIRLLINGPLYRGNKETQCFIPLNISMKEQPILEPKREHNTPIYKEIPTFAVFIMDEKEILAEKIRAILTRNKPRDIYDLWFLIARKNTPFDISLVNKKFALYNLKFDLVSLKNKIEKMKGLWNIDMKNLIVGELPDFGIAKEEIFKKLKI